MAYNFDLQQTVEFTAKVTATGADMPNLFVSDASDTNAFIYKADGSFEFVQDFEFTPEQAQFSSGHRELLAVKLALETNAGYFQKLAPTKIFWQTDSKNCFTFLTRGSKKPRIQDDVFCIKKLEKLLKIVILPVWTPRSHNRIVLADLGSKLSHSTDEWSVNREDLKLVFVQLQFFPTIDAFATGHNRVCEQFFSLFPQSGAIGLNFFAQSLSKDEKYFCCPPVSQIIPCFLKLVSTPSVSAILIVPMWLGAVHWPFLFNGCRSRSGITNIVRFQARFFFANQASSPVFCRNPNFDMLALKIET